MAWVIGGKKFGQYTYEHWFDDEYKVSDAKDICEQDESEQNNSEKDIKTEN